MDMTRIRIEDLNDRVDLDEKDLDKVTAGANAKPTQKFGSLGSLSKSSRRKNGVAVKTAFKHCSCG